MTPSKLMLALALTLFVAVPVVASTTWYVDGVNGNDNNDCKSAKHACKTIGHAISLAHSGDSVMVAAATYTENLTISISLRILGGNANETIIDGGGVGTVVTISNTTADVTLARLTIQNGISATGGGGISNSGTLRLNNITIIGNGLRSTVSGGGIYNAGTLTINNSTISENSVFCGGPRGCSAWGGGIDNEGTLTINSSTISGNWAIAWGCPRACIADGGGIYNGGTLTINNSTISGNAAAILTSACQYGCTTSGGGIYNYTYGALTINNGTISGNAARSSHGCQYGCITSGGGISNDWAATLQNSIVASSPSGGNCYGNITSSGYNLSSDNTCNFTNTGDLNNTRPKLGTLGNHGGPTQTIPLLSGSPAIDAGNPNGCTDGNGHRLKTDQRGKPRPDKEDESGCDMGAFEKQSD